MKTAIRHTVSAFVALISLAAIGCSEKGDPSPDINPPIIEGPSADDTLDIPDDIGVLGDSIMYTRAFPLSEYTIKAVSVNTTQNGHIAVLGGYRNQSAVHVFAKIEDDRKDLGDMRIKSILDKYYDVEYEVSGEKIVVGVREKIGVPHGEDYRDLRISVKVYVPQNVSTTLSIGRGSIIAKNVRGNSHCAESTSGAIKYLNSFGNSLTVTSQTGYVGLINTTAVEYMQAGISKGSIQIALPKSAGADLKLESSANVNAHILNNSNFSGINTRTRVEGKLNGGGFSLAATGNLGAVNLRWYNGGQDDDWNFN